MAIAVLGFRVVGLSFVWGVLTSIAEHLIPKGRGRATFRQVTWRIMLVGMVSGLLLVLVGVLVGVLIAALV
ncbi:MAG TPA: hypothetical protein VMY35_16480 [Phycisphaerae bacterium]|nr:hypothetical protein [Phycisphaerae bacterium]